ncbi:unnamed protein product [Strongylus vulgaris]|uniref:Protein kinase domain-containing protein n=1 Tax=Strongylus vulgaris TaxID=40348 RepID=A0A3P7JTM6_STRVU|nr:unnamed protein product [Strongylus vulgaris]
MAPEAYKFQQYSEASDVWSYGVVLWELLTRKDPHQGQLPITVAYIVDPEKRPTFAHLLDQFLEYQEELERSGFSVNNL